MTKDQIIQVISGYQKYLQGAQSIRFEDRPEMQPTYYQRRNHLSWMCSQILEDKIQGEKLHRWLGFLQGTLWALGYCSISEMRNENR